MRIVSWNLQHGGGSRIEKIADALLPHEPDVIVLCEYRHNEAGGVLRDRLRAEGFPYQSAAHADPGDNTMFVAARRPFEAVTFPGQVTDPDFGDFTDRVLLARFEDLNIFGIYMPSRQQKRPVFEFLLNLPDKFREEDSVLIGHFNTGKHYEDEAGAKFVSADQFEELLGQGWIDAWRKRNPEATEFTWFSQPANYGFRLDNALVSPSLHERTTNVWYSHTEREAGVSDHSLMVLEVRPHPDAAIT